MKLTKNFSLEELCHTSHNISNSPSLHERENLLKLCVNVLQPVRDHFNSVIMINSGFRNPILNAKVKGANNSDHIFGKAADITVGSKFGNELLFNWIRDNCEFKELINEHDFKWVHVSYDEHNNEKQILKIK